MMNNANTQTNSAANAECAELIERELVTIVEMRGKAFEDAVSKLTSRVERMVRAGQIEYKVFSDVADIACDLDSFYEDPKITESQATLRLLKIAANLRNEDNTQTIQPGDRVRSFDFAEGEYGRDLTGPRAAFIEGVVEKIAENSYGCPCYYIKVTRDVFRGEESQRRIGRVVTPPVNGTPGTFGDLTNFVDKL